MDEPQPLGQAGHPVHDPGPPLPPSFTARMRAVFAGRDGLRAGWRFLLYLVMGFTIFSVLRGLVDLRQTRSLPVFFYDKVAFLISVTTPAYLMARLERRSFWQYGLAWRSGMGRKFWTGAVWGATAITLLLLLLRCFHAYDFGGLALHGARIAKFAVFWGGFFLLVGLSEEFLLRGYTQFTLTQGIGFWPAAVLLSVAFGALHLGNGGEAAIGLVAAGVIGFFFCLTLRRTGDLWFAVGFHTFWDWGESYVYSVRDSGMMLPGHLLNSRVSGPGWLSGGSVGPEGSVFVFVIIALLWVAFDRAYPRLPPRHGDTENSTLAS